MLVIRVLFAFLVPLLSSASATLTTGTSERQYALPDHGYFVLQVPRDWKDQVRQPPNRLPPTIVFSRTSGYPFQILLTPIWSMRKDRPPDSRDDLRAAVEQAAHAAKSQAVESELPIIEFQGRSGPGFYFSATDRAPKPGEYKFLNQGILRVGELTVTFTILTNDGQELIVKQALDLLKSAAHKER
jgi:hypothetical protein